MGLVLLIFLASIGIGGGVPIPLSNRKENHIEIKVALKDAEEGEKLTVADFKK